jgi:hypothetical protein
MESTGSSWRPVFTRPAGRCAGLVVDASRATAVPGRETDVNDAEWLADRQLHGLPRASVIPRAGPAPPARPHPLSHPPRPRAGAAHHPPAGGAGGRHEHARVRRRRLRVGSCAPARAGAEMALVPFAPTVAAAIHDATGVWLSQQPMTPERVLDALEGR